MDRGNQGGGDTEVQSQPALLGHSKANAMSRPRTSIFRKSWIGLSLAGLALTSGLWMAAAFIALVHRDTSAGMTVGFAWGEQWLANAVVRADGSILLQHFDHNLTGHDGLYAKPARSWSNERTAASVLPRASSNKISRTLIFHLLLPLLVFAGLTAYSAGLPLLRGLRRRRLSACLACGYSLRNASSQVCPECGYANAYLAAERAT